MGNHHSCRSINKGSSILNDSNMKIKHSPKQPTFLNPDNHVLPVALNGPQALRSTDNGNILQNGGTISGRKSIHSLETNHGSEFIQYLQNRSQAIRCFPSNDHFPQAALGHKKSHSDPDIVRKILLEENETEDTDSGLKYESECSTNHRTRIALSPSKAKIRSRKKKKAPEPPKPNTLPRTMNGRNKFRQSAPEMDDIQDEHIKVPKRPLPPIPLDDLPPSPPPDYNKFARENNPPDISRSSSEKRLSENSLFTSNRHAADLRRAEYQHPRVTHERELPVYHNLQTFLENSSSGLNKSASSKDIPATSVKCFQKNQRNLDQRKLIRTDGSIEKLQKSKSLERLETLRLRETEENMENQRFRKGSSFRNTSINYNQGTQQNFNVPNKAALNNGIIEAARGRMERMNRNPSFKSSMNLSDDDEPQKERYRNNRPNQNNGFLRKTEIPSRSNHSSLESFRTQAFPEENGHQSKKPQSSNSSSGNSSDHKMSELVFPNSRPNGNCKRYTEKSVNRKIMPKGFKANDGSLISRENGYNQPNINNYGNDMGRNKPQRFSPVYSPDGRICNDHNLNKVMDVMQNSFFDANGNNDFKNKSDDNDNYHLSKGKNEHLNYRDYSSPKNGYSETNKYKYSFVKKDGNECLANSYPNNCVYKTELQSMNGNEIIGKGLKNSSRLEYEIFHELSKENSIVSVLPTSTVSNSSNSEDELDIKLQLRPTLPRRPINKFRFSPMDVWKSINLDSSREYSRSDISTDEGDDILEDTIHRIQKTVAPRRILHERSGDSGISPGAGSPMFIDDYLPPTDNELCCTYPVDSTNAIWIPQQDIEDSDCGSGSNMHESKLVGEAGNLQPKLALPNFMFPSRSFPRTNHKRSLEGKDTLGREKGRFKGRRKRHYKNSETQHFNSLRNLKRALGLRTNEPTSQKANGLDSNWSLTRSLPNMEVLNKKEYSEAENKVSEIDYSDLIQRNDLNCSTMHQESDIQKMHNGQNSNPDWQKYFAGHSKDGHVMYLPEYRSAIAANHLNGQENPLKSYNQADVNNNASFSQQVPTHFSQQMFTKEQTDKQNKFKKMFSYQSTLRKLEKKKIEEKLAREVGLKEKKREQEIEWMNMVEEEFRKQRLTEKSDVKQRLRVFTLLESKNKSSDNCDSESNEDEFETRNIYIENDYRPDISNEANIPGQNFGKYSKLKFSENIASLKPNARNAPEGNAYGNHQNFRGKRLPFTSKNLHLEMNDFQDNINKEELRKKYVPLQEIVNNGYEKGCEFKDSSKLSDVLNYVQMDGLRSYNLTENSNRLQDISKESHFEKEKPAKMQLRTTDNISIRNTERAFAKLEEQKQGRKYYMQAPPPAEKDGEAKENEPKLNQVDRIQPTGMKKWLRQQNRTPMSHENIPRPEPEGGRSPKDNAVDGIERGSTNQVPATVKKSVQCSHGNEYPCRNCFLYESQCRHFSREGASGRLKRLKTEVNKEIQAKLQKSQSRGPTSESPTQSLRFTENDGIQTRTNGKQTFESLPSYGFEKGKDDYADVESPRKRDSTDHHQSRLFTSPSFERELKKNGRRKSMDLEKQSRNLQSRDSDSDNSEEGKKENHFRRHLTRVKKSDQRHPSFTRNHPLRRVKHQSSTPNGRTANMQRSGDIANREE